MRSLRGGVPVSAFDDPQPPITAWPTSSGVRPTTPGMAIEIEVAPHAFLPQAVEVVPTPDEPPIDLAALERIERELAGVDDALARIDAGTYGRCESCGDPINAERLRIDPTARLCAAHPMA